MKNEATQATKDALADAETLFMVLASLPMGAEFHQASVAYVCDGPRAVELLRCGHDRGGIMDRSNAAYRAELAARAAFRAVPALRGE